MVRETYGGGGDGSGSVEYPVVVDLYIQRNIR